MRIINRRCHHGARDARLRDVRLCVSESAVRCARCPVDQVEPVTDVATFLAPTLGAEEVVVDLTAVVADQISSASKCR